jgi:hypothetical protein
LDPILLMGFAPDGSQSPAIVFVRRRTDCLGPFFRSTQNNEVSMLTDPLWGSTGDISVPSPQQLAQGFSCGSADPALFNWLFQQVYGEIGDVISTMGGLTPDASDITQVRQAIEAYVGARVGAPTMTLLTSGVAATWSPGATTRWLILLVQGAGGAGGGAAGNGAGTSASGGGGGAGGWSLAIEATPAATYTYTVGAGGVSGSAGSHAGGAGGTTQIAGGVRSITVTGGGGGFGDLATVVGTTSVGGSGGVATGGNLNVGGALGRCGASADATLASVANGGNALLGVGGVGGITSGGSGAMHGSPGSGFGGGGGGGVATGVSTTTLRFGGAGGNGAIVIWEFKNAN